MSAPGGQSIEPGKSVNIKVTVPTGYIDDKTFQKAIQVRTNDPAKKNISLTVSADIIKALVVEPLAIDFGEVYQGNTYKKELAIANKGKEAISVTQLQIVPNVLRIMPSEAFTLYPGETKNFTIEFTPNDTIKHLEGQLFIDSSLLMEFIKIKAEVLTKEN